LDEGPICLDINGQFIDDPLTTAILRQLDFTPYAEEVLSRLESDVSNGKLERIRHSQQISRLEQEV